MRSSLIYVLVISIISMALCQKQPKPDVNCDAMKSESGKRYHEIYVPHETNCNKFYQCTDHGLVELSCLKGLVFFPQTEGCVLKDSNNCIIWDQWRNLSP